MDQTQGLVTCGRGSKSRGTRHPAVGGGSDHPKLQIQWLSASLCTQKVIDHLRDHPADCRILFSSDEKQLQNESDRPSGKDKLSVCAVITKLRRKYSQILKEFPWYDELIDIMGGNPAISLKTVLSHPGVDHAAKYFSISRTTSSSYSNSLGSGSTQFSA
ncbi:hypothetical protein P692DRAFT_201808019 [Suillus brevipes Sb2]|nr:hypothetical protein P692DRAFT_201808019 [Suillus brevipes Sb2]